MLGYVQAELEINMRLLRSDPYPQLEQVPATGPLNSVKSSKHLPREGQRKARRATNDTICISNERAIWTKAERYSGTAKSPCSYNLCVR